MSNCYHVLVTKGYDEILDVMKFKGTEARKLKQELKLQYPDATVTIEIGPCKNQVQARRATYLLGKKKNEHNL